MKPAIGIIVPLHPGGETTEHMQCSHATLLAIQAAGGQVQLLPILTAEKEQDARSKLTEALAGVDGLLLTRETPLPFASVTEHGVVAWWESRACRAAHDLGLPVLGLGRGACQLVTAFGGSLHPAATTRRTPAARDTAPTSPTLVMLDRTCLALCMPESKAHQLRACEDVLAAESAPSLSVKKLASPFTAWAWSCRDASVVGFGTHLGERGWYAIGTCLPVESESIRSTLFSRLIFGSFVAAARERGTRGQQSDDFCLESSILAMPGSQTSELKRASSSVLVTASLAFSREGWGM